MCPKTAKCKKRKTEKKNRKNTQFNLEDTIPDQLTETANTAVQPPSGAGQRSNQRHPETAKGTQMRGGELK